MNRQLASLTTFVFTAGLAAACSSATVPAGSDDGGTDSGAKPDARGDSGSLGDGGDCCPASYDLYSCTYKDGTKGFACHNPEMGCAGSTTCGEGCDPVVTGRCGTTSSLKWYATCGYPVCHEGGDAGPLDSGVCPAEGTSCATKGATCGTPDERNCGVTLVCDDHDPTLGGCPKSSRKFKNGIQYLDDAERQSLHDETLGIKLATYKYKGEYDDPNPTHLGFIIEDNPQSLSVERGFDRVDLYGYVSMVVASMQVQETEIAALRTELAATKRQAAACGAPRK
jgi:hypothetical protein